MSYVPPQYTPYVYTMHNVRALDTHFQDLLDAHHCADYLQSDARGEILDLLNDKNSVTSEP